MPDFLHPESDFDLLIWIKVLDIYYLEQICDLWNH